MRATYICPKCQKQHIDQEYVKLHNQYNCFDCAVGRSYTQLLDAIDNPVFPCNPIPFAQGLADYVRDHGTNSIKSNDAKRILWVLMGQAYGQLATIDLVDEGWRLSEESKRPGCEDI